MLFFARSHYNKTIFEEISGKCSEYCVQLSAAENELLLAR